MRIDVMTQADWSQVAEVYGEGIATGDATFESEVPSWDQWDASHLAECRFVARDAEGVLGWAALAPVSRRACYRGVAEVSVYVREGARGRGVGRALLEHLVAASETAGVWTLQGATFPENVPSLRLQAACGFRVVGHRERIARLHGRWRDTVLTERRGGSVFQERQGRGGPPRSGELEIRPFLEADTERVVALWSRCGLLRPWNDPRKDIARKLRVQRELFMVGELAGEIVAAIMVGYEGHRGWVNYLAVEPELQGRGLGRQMMAEAERRLLAMGCPKIQLQVRKDNVGAIEFYRRLGYAEDAVVNMGRRLVVDERAAGDVAPGASGEAGRGPRAQG